MEIDDQDFRDFLLQGKNLSKTKKEHIVEAIRQEFFKKELRKLKLQKINQKII